MTFNQYLLHILKTIENCVTYLYGSALWKTNETCVLLTSFFKINKLGDALFIAGRTRNCLEWDDSICRDLLRELLQNYAYGNLYIIVFILMFQKRMYIFRWAKTRNLQVESNWSWVQKTKMAMSCWFRFLFEWMALNIG